MPTCLLSHLTHIPSLQRPEERAAVEKPETRLSDLMPDLSLSSHVTLNKWLTFWFPHVYNGAGKSAHVRLLLWRLSEKIHVKSLNSNYSINVSYWYWSRLSVSKLFLLRSQDTYVKALWVKKKNRGHEAQITKNLNEFIQKPILSAYAVWKQVVGWRAWRHRVCSLPTLG